MPRAIGPNRGLAQTGRSVLIAPDDLATAARVMAEEWVTETRGSELAGRGSAITGLQTLLLFQIAL